MLSGQYFFHFVADENAGERGLLPGDRLNLELLRYPSGKMTASLFIVRRQVDPLALITALGMGWLRLAPEDETRGQELQELLEETHRERHRPRLELVKGGAP
jgi:hypothetical protein